MLAQRLRHLERIGLIQRSAAESGRSVEYRLTAAGNDLKPVLRVLGEWAAHWAFGDPDPAELDPDLLISGWPATCIASSFPWAEPCSTISQSGQALYRMVLGATSEVSVCLRRPASKSTWKSGPTPPPSISSLLGRAELGGAMQPKARSLDRVRSSAAFVSWFAWSAFAPASAERRRTAAAQLQGL